MWILRTLSPAFLPTDWWTSPTKRPAQTLTGACPCLPTGAATTRRFSTDTMICRTLHCSIRSMTWKWLAGQIERPTSNMSASLSCIVPCRNAQEYLSETIANALAEGADELVFVDDGSTDDSAAIATAPAGPARYPRQAAVGAGAA